MRQSNGWEGPALDVALELFGRKPRRVRCLESGRATGLHIVPIRRIRCIVCSRLIQLREFGEHIIVPIHYVPAERRMENIVLGSYAKAFEGIDA
jgi:hypothetical protein